MKKNSFILHASFIPWFVVFFLGIAGQAAGERAVTGYVPGEIIVKFKARIAVSEIQGVMMTGIASVDVLNKEFQATEMERIFPQKHDYPLATIYRLQFAQETLKSQVLDSYRNDPNIVWAEPNYIYRITVEPNDPYYSSQWYLPKIQAPAAWDLQQGSSTVVIGIIDSGVDTDHPDLASHIWTNSGETPGNGKDDDANGFVDDVHGWDFVQMNNDPNPNPDGRDNNNMYGPDDGVDHGTHVAGITAAIGNNSAGIAGVSWNCSIMPVRVLDDEGEGTFVDIARGIVYSVDNGADVINFSFGGPYSIVFNDEIAYAHSHGVTVVAAAGNEDQDIDKDKVSPACNDNNGNQVICVAATDKNDKKTSFSNYGQTFVDVSAPGLSIISTLYYDPPFGFNDYYGYYSGTSMSAPVVSGLAALIKSHKPDISNAEIGQLIIEAADNIDAENPGYAGRLGSGRINAFSAISAIVDENMPVVSIATVSDEFRLNSKASVDILVECISNLGAFEVELAYDGNKIRIDSSSHVIIGDFLGSTNRTVVPVGPVIDNEAGLVKFGGFSFGDSQAPSGSGILASIIWTPRDTGSTVLRFNKVQLTDEDGQNIPATSTNHAIKIIPYFWADINRDDQVDIVDIQMVAARWNSKAGDPDYDVTCDVDNDGRGDGDIDVVDIQLVAWWWHKPLPGSNSLIAAKETVNLLQNAIIKMTPGQENSHCRTLIISIENAALVAAFQFDLVFDNDNIVIEKMELGEFLKSSDNVTTLDSRQDRGDNTRTFAAFSYGAQVGASGAGVLARIIYKSKAGLDAKFAINNMLVLDPRGNSLCIEFVQDASATPANLTGLPKTYALAQNFPNPFNPETKIRYQLPEQADVRLEIHNLRGELVQTLVDEKQMAGYYTLRWNGKDQHNQCVPSGVYLCSLKTRDFVEVRKMILVR